MKAYEVFEKSKGKWTFKPTPYLASLVGGYEGSYLVLPARLFGINYVNYNKMVRDVYGATLLKGEGWYVGVEFNERARCVEFVNEVNRRFEALVVAEGDCDGE